MFFQDDLYKKDKRSIKLMQNKEFHESIRWVCLTTYIEKTIVNQTYSKLGISNECMICFPLINGSNILPLNYLKKENTSTKFPQNKEFYEWQWLFPLVTSMRRQDGISNLKASNKFINASFISNFHLRICSKRQEMDKTKNFMNACHVFPLIIILKKTKRSIRLTSILQMNTMFSIKENVSQKHKETYIFPYESAQEITEIDRSLIANHVFPTLWKHGD